MSRDPVAAADQDLHPVRLVRATPRSVWLLVAVFGFLSFAYAVAVPLLHAPDEPAHVDLLATVHDHLGLDPYAGLTYSPDVEAAVRRMGIEPIDFRFAPRQPWRPLDASETVPRADRPPYADLAPPGTGTQANPAASHPPGYYVTIAGIDAVAQWFGAGSPASVPWDALVFRWRVWSLLLALPLPWLVFWTAVRVTRRRQVAVTASVLVLAIPQLAHSAGSVNNDVLLFTVCGATTMAAAWIVTGDRSWQTAVLGGVAAGVAMITKVFGLGAPTWLLAAYGGAALLGHLRIGAAIGRLAAAGATAVVAGGWWPLRLLVTTGTPAPRGFEYPIPEDLRTPVGHWLTEVVRRLTTTGLGFFGIEQFALPAWLVALATIGFVVSVIAGIVVVARSIPAGWIAPAVLVMPLLTTLAMVLYAAWGGYARSGLPTGLHGRYLFVALVGIAPLAAAGLGAWLRRGAALLTAAVAIVLVLQTAGLTTVATSYWAGPSHLRTMVTFSPWSGRVLAAVAMVGALACVGAAAALVREAGNASADGGRPVHT